MTSPPETTATPTWYIVRSEAGTCEICDRLPEGGTGDRDYWGPFDSPQTAIARRVGLIRAGKCQPQ